MGSNKGKKSVESIRVIEDAPHTFADELSESFKSVRELKKDTLVFALVFYQTFLDMNHPAIHAEIGKALERYMELSNDH